MSLLTDAEIYAMENILVLGINWNARSAGVAGVNEFARALEARLLAKLAGMEPPEWSKRDDLGGLVPSEIRQALRQAYAQGAASQLSAEPAGYTTTDCVHFFLTELCAKEHGEIIPLFTRKEPS